MTVTRVLPNTCTDRMEETRGFYVNLLGFVVGTVHPGWYIQLVSPTDPRLQLGIVRRDAEFTPETFQHPAQGLGDQDFGMRHFMIAEPNGLLVNVLAFP